MTPRRKQPKPSQVRQVYDALIANARAAGLKPLSRQVACYYSEPSPWSGPEAKPEWHVGDNIDCRSPSSLIYRPDLDQWFSRDHEGVDKPYSFEAAMSDASIWWTG